MARRRGSSLTPDGDAPRTVQIGRAPHEREGGPIPESDGIQLADDPAGQLAAASADLARATREVGELRAVVADQSAALAHASELETRFLSNLTHELRTPINSILGLTSLLLQEFDGPLTSEQRVQVGYVRASAEALSGFVNGLLELAKAGRLPTELAPVSVARLFDELATRFRAAEGVALRFADPADLTVTTDRTKLGQLLDHLMSNAVKFTSSGEIALSAAAEGDRVRFRVRDTGVGIRPEDLEQLFGQHGRVGANGAGLGLRTARALVRSLGGEISVTSEPGAGATFDVLLPASPPHGPAANPSRPRLP